MLLQIGRDLRTLTEKFANSDERRHVKESADQVRLDSYLTSGLFEINLKNLVPKNQSDVYLHFRLSLKR